MLMVTQLPAYCVRLLVVAGSFSRSVTRASMYSWQQSERDLFRLKAVLNVPVTRLLVNTYACCVLTER